MESDYYTYVISGESMKSKTDYSCCYVCPNFTIWDDCMLTDFVGFCKKYNFAVPESIADNGCNEMMEDE